MELTSEVLPLLAVTASAFVATNVDSLLLLVGMLWVEGETRRRLAAYGVATALVIGACLVLARAGDLVPPHLLGWLGLVPLVLGLLGVVELVRGGGAAAQSRGGPEGFAAATALFLSVSGDNFAVFVPLMAESPTSADWLIAGTIAVLAAGWAGLARWLALRPGRSEAIPGFAGRVVPFVLIAVGVYILLDTSTDL